MDKKIIDQLIAIVGPDHLATSPEELACYSYDGSGRKFPPEAVAFPGSVEEVSSIMTLAHQLRFPVVVRGAGTGMTGGSLPLQGGLVLAMSRMNRIIEINRDNHIAVVEPGVITGEFQTAVKKVGLFYPPDPASLKFCTLGGNVAECAGGPSAVKYGVTRDYVLGLEAVLPDGRIIHTGVRTAKGVMGYDLTRLLVGSEGTLAVITKITLRLLAQPSHRATFLAVCGSISQATELVTAILATHLPCNLEYLDRTAISIVAGDIPFALPEQTQALLLIELDGDEASVIAQAARLKKFLTEEATLLDLKEARTPDEARALWTARRSVSPSAFKLKPHKISEDIVVPRSKIPALVKFTEEISRDQPIIIFTFGHAGDGNIHVNIMLNRDNPAELAAAMQAKQQLFETVIRLGGTLSGEHGTGMTKSDYLAMEIDSNTIAVMQSIKTLLDPHNILNPGKIFPVLHKAGALPSKSDHLPLKNN